MTDKELEAVVRAIEGKRRRSEIVAASVGYGMTLLCGAVLGAIAAGTWPARCVG